MKIFDGHNDVLLELTRYYRGKVKRSFFQNEPDGHLDMKRAIKGKYAGGFFAIFIPQQSVIKNRDEHRSRWNGAGRDALMDAPLDLGYARYRTFEMMAMLLKIERESKGKFQIVKNYDQLMNCFNNDIMSSIIHFEGAEAIDCSLDSLYVFYEAGLRSLGITWSRPNAFGYGVPMKFPASPDTGPGLTPYGKNLVKVCNELGIIIDLAHMNQKGFFDVANLSDSPLIYSHTGVHSICPSSRNITDDQIKIIANSNGVIGINFYVGDLRDDGKLDSNTSIYQLVKHIDYIINLVGDDHVALGSDFEGAIISNEIKDVAGLQKIVTIMESKGYSKNTIEKICHKNWFRIIKNSWK